MMEEGGCTSRDTSRVAGVSPRTRRRVYRGTAPVDTPGDSLRGELASNSGPGHLGNYAVFTN